MSYQNQTTRAELEAMVRQRLNDDRTSLANRWTTTEISNAVRDAIQSYEPLGWRAQLHMNSTHYGSVPQTAVHYSWSSPGSGVVITLPDIIFIREVVLSSPTSTVPLRKSLWRHYRMNTGYFF